jgi:sugar phosphate isomerase/epimerase
MKLSLAIQTPEVPVTLPVALLSGTLDEKLAKAARLGVEGVELMTTDPAALDRANLRAALRQHGLEAAAIASGGLGFALGLTLIHADPARSALAWARLRDLIDLAAELSAPVVTIGSFRGRLAAGGADAREHLIAGLREQGNYAGSRGVRLVLEPLNRYEADVILNADQGLAFIDEIGAAYVGLLLDTYHVNIEERSWTEPFRRVSAADRLWHVHLGDNNRLPPGQGLIDFPGIVQTLREVGYAGYLSAELLPRPDPDAAAEATVTYMRRVLAG